MKTLFLLLALSSISSGQEKMSLSEWSSAPSCVMSVNGGFYRPVPCWWFDPLPVTTRHPRLPLVEPEIAFAVSGQLPWHGYVIPDYKSVLVDPAIKKYRHGRDQMPASCAVVESHKDEKDYNFKDIADACARTYVDFTCADPSRVLLTSENGLSHYCVKF